MKKKILSIILASVMLLAMIPAFSVGASNPEVETLMDAKYYRTVITADTIIVDGQLDDAYNGSQKIYAAAGSTSSVNFKAYTAVTLKGFYVWAEITGGASFRVYNLMDDGRAQAWGWYEISKNGTVTATSKGTTALVDATVSTVETGSGWRAEIFVPFAVQLLNFTNYKLNIALSAINGSSVSYDRSEVTNAETSNANYKPLRLVTWIDRSPAFAPNKVYSMNEIFANEDVPVHGGLINSAVYVANGGFTIDGRKDAIYSEHNKIPLITWHTYHENAQPIGAQVSDMGYVYTAFDNENLYVYYERYDEELLGSEQLKTYYYFEDESGVITAGYLNFEIDYAWFGNSNTNWPGTKIDSANITYKRATLGTNLYGAEYKMVLPSGIQEMLAAGKDVKIKIAFDTVEENSTYNNSNGKKVNLSSSYPDAYNMYDYTAGADFIDPNNFGTTMLLSKSFTADKYGKIEGAKLQLGADITVNYYATIGTGDVHNAYMKFTRGKTEYIAYPRKVEGSTMYAFAFKGLAPQTLGDNIKAELYIDGELVSTKDGYSAKQNCQNLLAKEEYRDNVKMNNLIKSLLNYGTAAQGYAKYNTETPINEGYRVVLNTPTAADSVRSISSPISNDIKMTALGVYFDSVNKMYVKFVAPSLDGITVTFNGEEATIEKSGDRYIAYSEAVPVSQFGISCEIVLSNGSASQTATYSINSYTYAKLTSEDETMVELAKATYTYGDAAKKYAGFSDTVYTVMTYNDADNNAPYEDLHGNVMTIIKESMPDLIGMQEVQQSQQDDYKSAFEAMNYGWLWESRGASSNGDHYWGELSKPSGVAIAYNKDKFTLISNKHLWLSDTPNKASKYDDSDYTYDFHAALLQDNTTGEQFVFVSAHCDYTGTANVKQITKLLELCETDNQYLSYGQYRKIYVADWNFGHLGLHTGLNAAGAKLMYEAGYADTGDQISGIYRPSTTAPGATLDCCFTDTSEFQAIDYKVINTELALYTSDHYPVFSKIVVKQSYGDVLLEGIYEFPELPEDPTYKDHDDNFVTEDDTDGFVLP